MSLSGTNGRKAAGTPVLIGGDGTNVRLERLTLNAGEYNEAWLQKLAFEHPEILPIADFEPGFGELRAVAREVPCAHGYIDNLYVTGSGELVLAECKLWRNPQARREVVAQALDYVAALTQLSYEEFERACTRGQGMIAPSLHAVVAERPDALAEQEFVDAVSRNLRSGRMIVLVLGDGIRSETEALSELLQSHAGAHFTFALVELASWRNPLTGEIVVLPSTLARTAMITRGIVTIEGVAGVSIKPVATAPGTKPVTISEELYFEELDKKHPGLAALVKQFLVRLEPLGIYPDLMASLNLKADLPGAERATNFGYITKGGKLWTDTLAWTAPASIALVYNERLAELIGGEVAYTASGSSYVSTNGKSGPKISQFLPHHSDAWLEAVSNVVDAIRIANCTAGRDG